MIDRGLVTDGQLLDGFDQIEAGLSRFPAVDPATFRNAVLAFLPDAGSGDD